MMKFRRLKLAQCNIYYKNDGATLAADYAMLGRLKCHSLGVVEYVKGSIPGMQRSNPGRPIITPGCREVQTFVRSNKNIIKEYRVKATEAVKDDPLAHDRWIDVAVYKFGNRTIAHITTHFNAGIQGPEGRPLLSLARTREYAKHVDKLEEVIDAHQSQAHDVFVTMDGNYLRPSNPGVGLWAWSPQKIMGFAQVEHRIDYILYDPQRWKVTHSETIETRGSDHLVIFAKFKPI